MTKDKIKQITEYLFANSVNKSSNTTTLPKDVIKGDVEITNISIDLDMQYNQLLVRCKFSGSKTYFGMGIELDDAEDWFKIVSGLYRKKEKPSFIDSFGSSEANEPFDPLSDLEDAECDVCHMEDCVCERGYRG